MDSTFHDTTFRSEHIEAESITIRNEGGRRQLSLSDDLGIYLLDENGRKMPLNPISEGSSGSLAMYGENRTVRSVPWINVGDDDKVVRVQGSILVDDVTYGREGSSVASAITSLTQILATLRSEVNTIQEAVKLLQAETTSIRESSSSGSNDHLAFDPNSTQDREGWKVKSGKDIEGRATLDVTYEGKVASTFLEPHRERTEPSTPSRIIPTPGVDITTRRKVEINVAQPSKSTPKKKQTMAPAKKE